jgi:hypothetical protein
MKGGARELKTKNTRQRHTRWVHGFPSRQLLGLVPFPYSSKPSIVYPAVAGDPWNLPLHSHQFFVGLALFLFPRSRKPPTTSDISLCLWNSLPAAFGAGPFSVQFKTKFIPRCRGRLLEFTFAQSPVGLAPFPYSSKPSITPRCRGGLLEFTFAQSPVFLRSGPSFTKKHRRQQLCGSVGQRS